MILPAPEPTWERPVDVVIVGSGVAGLSAALGLARAGRRVVVATKGVLSDGSTGWAQGGMAAPIAPGDTAADHVRDTLVAGAGLSDETVVRDLVDAAPGAVAYLESLGARFDRDLTGGPAFAREGGHSAARVLRSGGDATGRELLRALTEAVLAAPVEVIDHAFALDAVRDGAGQVTGVSLARLDPAGRVRDVGVIRARAVVLATGGFGQLYPVTSNPAVATGDGLALALRAGADVVDVEFVQFHPTVLAVRGSGRQLLLSEALRGEGAVLVDALGEAVMAGVDPRGDLAPRDVVSLAIARRMAGAPGGASDHVYLDARGLGPELERRFPTIVAGCRDRGIDPVTEPVPVAPAAHYSCGGVRAELSGHTRVPGLYAVGEVAGTGAHGANRLASNSLLEGLVMGTRLGAELADALPARRGGTVAGPPVALPSERDRRELAGAMARYAGVLRSPDGLAAARAVVDRMGAGGGAVPGRGGWEAANLRLVAAALLTAATARTESRGAHNRTDWPEPRAEWCRRLTVELDPAGRPVRAGGVLA